MEPTHDNGNSLDAVFAWVAFLIHVRRSGLQILVRRLAVLTEAFHGFLYSLQATGEIVGLLPIVQLSHFFTAFPIYFAQIIPPLDGVQYETLTVVV